MTDRLNVIDTLLKNSVSGMKNVGLQVVDNAIILNVPS